MSAKEPAQEADWYEASVPPMPTDSNLADQTLRKPIIEFLRAASDGKLRAAELDVHAASIVQAWVTPMSKDNATE
jgi:hypothetical protein